MKFLAALLCTLLLAACSTTAPTSKPPTQPDAQALQVLIYIYRSDSPALGNRDASFYVDDINVADLSRNRHTWFIAPAGEHRLKQDWPINVPMAQTLEGKVQWVAGQTYYYKLSAESELTYPDVTVRWRLASAQPDIATNEIRTTRYQPAYGAARLQTQRAAP